jgi:hypothetical protein
MVFLSGQASPEWLSCIGSSCQLEPEVLFPHMRFLPSAEREPYFEPGLRSARASTLRFCVPTIVSIDPKSRHISRHELDAARKDIDSSLRKNFNRLENAPYSEAGQPFFQRIDVHTGDFLTTEQEISITLLVHNEKHPVSNVQRASEVPRLNLPGVSQCLFGRTRMAMARWRKCRCREHRASWTVIL